MVIMDTYYLSDHLQELWQTINHIHMSYLEMEESPEKLNHRMRLEDCIREFLCITSHSHKFYLRETGDILYRSATMKKDFSGYKAATGWNAIQMYAGNLLSQPWRKEYRQIKLYCGFYKHQIEANLVGAEMMFQVMGYRFDGNGILTLDGPICPDRVTTVSRDCLIAYVECQIIKAIWEEISPSFKISWLEVLEFRKSHLCTPEQSIRALNFQFQEKQYQVLQNSELYNRCHQNNTATINHYAQIPSRSHIVSAPVSAMPYTIYGTNNCCPNSYSNYTHAPCVPYPPPVIKPGYSNGFYCANGYVTQPPVTYGYSVPTGQLIELEPHQNGAYDLPDRPTNNLRMAKNSLTRKMEVKSTNKEQPSESHFEDWDYVYRDLESQGYSKDLGERGDILNPPANLKKTKATNLDEAINNLAVTDRPLKITEALQKYENEPTIKKNQEMKCSDSSSYENLQETKKAAVKIEKRKPVPTREKTVTNYNNNVNEAANKPTNTQKAQNNKWECKTCTFHNDYSKDICEICSKSRDNVEQQMEIGGPECGKCTLVNAKDSIVCQACNASLENSPTYI